MSAKTASPNAFKNRFDPTDPKGMMVVDKFSWSMGSKRKGGVYLSTFTYKVQINASDDENRDARISRNAFNILFHKMDNLFIKHNRSMMIKAGREDELERDVVMEMQEAEQEVLKLVRAGALDDTFQEAAAKLTALDAEIEALDL